MNDINNFNFNNIFPLLLHIADRYCDSNWYVPLGVKDFHNFMFILSGKGTIVKDSIEHDMLPGMLVYHSPGQNFGFTTSQTNPMHCFGVNFHLAAASFIQGKWFIETVDTLPFNTITHINDIDLLAKLFTDLSTTWDEARKNFNLKCQGIFSSILYEISRQIIMQHTNPKVLQKIELLTEYIHSHYKTAITINQLANLAGVSQGYLCVLFKMYTGQTPIEYINAFRIRKSEDFLSIGYSVTETASLVGFNDPFYFSKVFKKYMGVSPKCYINNFFGF